MNTVVEQMKQRPANFRFSGHETFPCRYTWLPKAVRNLADDSALFSDEDTAMVSLGVGKNMVRAIRFWADAAAVATPTKSRSSNIEVSDFGKTVFGKGGHDEFLEDIRTLWLIHWNFSTNMREPLFAWHFMLNYWHRTDFTRNEVLEAFQREGERMEKKLSPVTLDHHFTTFLHTYFPTSSKKGEVIEDNLDSPLVELELIQKVGERAGKDSMRREAIYAFRVEEKPEISAELFVYCLADFWEKRFPQEKTIPFRQVAVGEGSPGQVFKLPEQAMRERLESVERDSCGLFTYQESSALQQVVRQRQPNRQDLLERVYAHRRNS
jgi:hypothetical protein